MSKVWYCATCGYEIGSRGRCHQCHQRLVASPLRELAAGDDDDEVGYRLGDWEDRTRGRLIESLIEAEIAHRFEDDELVVAADDEERVDDLVVTVAQVPASATASPAGPGASESDLLGDPGATAIPDGGDEITSQVARLHHAAGRLRVDPTDMEADGDVAEASAAVFVTDRFGGFDEATWSAVGRTTRRLLAALGSEVALEDEIRRQAAILHTLLDDDFAAGSEGKGSEDEVPGVRGSKPGGSEVEGSEVEGSEVEVPGVEGSEVEGSGVEVEGSEVDREPSGETVYELPEWLPEQRAELTVLLDTEGITAWWDGGDLVVPAEREADAEALFDRVEGVSNVDADDEARYRAIEELFAATSRLVGDPANTARVREVIDAVPAVDGPTPLGFDDGQWWGIRSRARLLADSLEHGAHRDVIVAEATGLRDRLRALV